MTGQPLREVEAYLQALSRVRSAVQRCHPGGQGLASILHLYRSRSLEKAGRIQESVEYNVHGSGCLFVEASGAEVDVDFLEEGTEVFDAWRIRRLSVSLGEESSESLDEIVAACRKLVSLGRLSEPHSGWFSAVE
ncbi:MULTISPECIES: hypothetical protein [unclassified Streptomyces]|uniref:DUF6896 domain-containing protein n=1 Tax=unclassified Streptomyces TaxID=2593676 RepID=UPI002365EF9F|nr:MULTISPECIES: hypothetical protein [unclassified Streptomyces]MDF3140662.1 hypothetical protein [Streptomyces sp. T21Q-yed]WDF38500.1 hypothetical protein PBV52_17705 [Streptomyces sp. T12]